MTSESPVRAAPRVGRMTVTRRAVEQIKAMIADGTLHPGQRLPTERELAAKMGLSRSSMREAIRVLTTLGVLEARHGAGLRPRRGRQPEQENRHQAGQQTVKGDGHGRRPGRTPGNGGQPQPAAPSLDVLHSRKRAV